MPTIALARSARAKHPTKEHRVRCLLRVAVAAPRCRCPRADRSHPRCRGALVQGMLRLGRVGTRMGIDKLLVLRAPNDETGFAWGVATVSSGAERQITTSSGGCCFVSWKSEETLWIEERSLIGSGCASASGLVGPARPRARCTCAIGSRPRRTQTSRSRLRGRDRRCSGSS